MKKQIKRLNNVSLIEPKVKYIDGVSLQQNNHDIEVVEKTTRDITSFIMIFFGAIVIAIISGALRVQGIVVLFKVEHSYAIMFVCGIIFAELAIARAIVAKKTDLMASILKWIVFGSIQISMLALSFIIEYSSLANLMVTQKDTVEFQTGKVKEIKDTIADYERNIQMIQNNLGNISKDNQSLVQRNMKKIDDLTKKKDLARDELKKLQADSNISTAMTEKSGLGNTARMLGLGDEMTLGNKIALGFAGILNILYVALMWISMYNKKEDK